MSLEISAPQGHISFGVARRDITPPLGIYSRWWGAAATDQATGIHRPLTLSAFVIGPVAADRRAVQVVVAMDLCIVGWPEQQHILDAIEAGTGLRDNVFCVYSHTHACPVVDLDRVGLPGGDLLPVYLEALATAAAGAVQEAVEGMQEAWLVAGRGSCAVAANRDLPNPEGHGYLCGFAPDGVADDSVLVARVSDARGNVIATILNYACHATSLGWQSSLISPDFPGIARETVEAATGAPCIFLQGASGDIGPREGFVGDLETVERNGRALGYTALAVIDTLPPANTIFAYLGPTVSGTTLARWGHRRISSDDAPSIEAWHVERWTVNLPYRSDLAPIDVLVQERDAWEQQERSARLVDDDQGALTARAHVERLRRAIGRRAPLPHGPTFPFPVVAWTSGTIRWVAVEGEPYNVFQRELRSRLSDDAVFVLTLMNGGRIAYLPTASTYGKGIYEEQIAILAPGSLERLLDATVDHIKGWDARPETLATRS